MKEPSAYKYIENGSKNHSGGINDSSTNREVMIIADDEVGNRCHVYLLDLYISKLPKTVEHFYCYPLPKVDLSDGIWYFTKKVGTNPLQGMVKKMCAQAGIEGRKTNHSLRDSAATQLYEAGVPEKLIQERTGHRSIDALKEYERTTTNQTLAVSRVLASLQKRTYANTLQQVIDPPSIQKNPGQFTFNNCVVNINMAPSTSGSTGRVSVESTSTTETTADKFVDKVLSSTELPFLDNL